MPILRSCSGGGFYGKSSSQIFLLVSVQIFPQLSEIQESLNWLLDFFDWKLINEHVRPIFEMKWRPRSFSRVSTGDSDILSSCDMNDEHA